MHEPSPGLDNPSVARPLQVLRCVGGGCLSENYLEVGSILDVGKAKHATRPISTLSAELITQVTTTAWSRPAVGVGPPTVHANYHAEALLSCSQQA